MHKLQEVLHSAVSASDIKGQMIKYKVTTFC